MSQESSNGRGRGKTGVPPWQCPASPLDYENVTLGHGGGGKLSQDLVENVFLPAFGNPLLNSLADAAVFGVEGGRMAFSTDSYVVRPLFFPGGSIGRLAVHGTVNDLSMSGARPLYLSAGFIIEEGFPIRDLKRIADDMADAAREADVAVIAGDTKVVDGGHGDGCFINTSGVGVVDPKVKIGPSQAVAGDTILLSGTLADHGMAIMSAREGLTFESNIESDSAPLNRMVEEMIGCCPGIHVLRDPTRGGLAASLHEIARASNVGIEVDEPRIPINPTVQSACEIFGLDPLQVANEGKLVCIVAEDDAERLIDIMRSHPCGKHAARIGSVVEEHPGMVAAKTAIGAKRVVPLPIGEQLPRIC